jgi:hypothetical protein
LLCGVIGGTAAEPEPPDESPNEVVVIIEHLSQAQATRGLLGSVGFGRGMLQVGDCVHPHLS